MVEMTEVEMLPLLKEQADRLDEAVRKTTAAYTSILDTINALEIEKGKAFAQGSISELGG